MRFTTSVIALMAFATASAAHAQVDGRGAYVGVGVDALEFDSYTLSARGGYNFNDYFGLEAQAGFGISEENDTVDGLEIGSGVNYFVGGFGVLRAPLSEQFDVFARAGYFFGEVDGTITDTVNSFAQDIESDVDGFALGAGTQFNFGEGNLNGIRLEYTYLDVQDIDGVDVDELDAGGDLWSVSYIRRF